MDISRESGWARLRPAFMPIDETGRAAPPQAFGAVNLDARSSIASLSQRTADALHVPMAIVSLVDQYRGWFASWGGLGALPTSRGNFFFGRVVLERSPLIVFDAACDHRFESNPWVTGPPFIRAYFGVALHGVDHQAVGSLCVIDQKPRRFTDREMAMLYGYAACLEEVIHANLLHVVSNDPLILAPDGGECAAPEGSNVRSAIVPADPMALADVVPVGRHGGASHPAAGRPPAVRQIPPWIILRLIP